MISPNSRLTIVKYIILWKVNTRAGSWIITSIFIESVILISLLLEGSVFFPFLSTNLSF